MLNTAQLHRLLAELSEVLLIHLHYSLLLFLHLADEDSLFLLHTFDDLFALFLGGVGVLLFHFGELKLALHVFQLHPFLLDSVFQPYTFRQQCMPFIGVE